MIYLKKLSLSDDTEIYNMLQEITSNDNGFHNKVYGMSYEQFQEWLEKEYSVDKGNLEDWMVPQTSYWLYEDDKPIGYGRIRHCLNEKLKETSGHIGYAIRCTERKKVTELNYYPYYWKNVKSKISKGFRLPQIQTILLPIM